MHARNALVHGMVLQQYNGLQVLELLVAVCSESPYARNM